MEALYPLNGGKGVNTIQGGLGGLEIASLGNADIEELIETLHGLSKAERLVPGKYTLITGPDVTGVLAHEAFGHSQEGDTCARGRSKAWELYKSGMSVGNKHATIMNNPAMFTNGEHSFPATGSYFFDNEGWLAREQVILDEGILQPPMTDFSSALRLGVARSANGKRESWKRGCYARQTNTYFTSGDASLDELISRVDYGFFALRSAGGMEDPKGMGIQVGMAYLAEIKDGKLTGRLFEGPSGGSIQMTGYVPDLLNNIVDKSRILFSGQNPGKEPAHPENKYGGCGKYHKEFVNAGCGGTCLLLKNVLLG